jgi:hypothetical protein
LLSLALGFAHGRLNCWVYTFPRCEYRQPDGLELVCGWNQEAGIALLGMPDSQLLAMLALAVFTMAVFLICLLLMSGAN